MKEFFVVGTINFWGLSLCLSFNFSIAASYIVGYFIGMIVFMYLKSQRNNDSR